MRRIALPFLATILVISLRPPVASGQASKTLEPRDIAARSRNALVTIVALDTAGQPTSQGSGFFLSPYGVFATNFHVIEGASKLRVETLKVSMAQCSSAPCRYGVRLFTM